MDTVPIGKEFKQLHSIISKKCKKVTEEELKKYYDKDKAEEQKFQWKIVLVIIVTMDCFLLGLLISEGMFYIGAIIYSIPLALFMILPIVMLNRPWQEFALKNYKEAITLKTIEDIKEEIKNKAIQLKKELVGCKACGTTVSKMAETCIKCGENSPGLWIHCPRCQSLSVGAVSKGFGAKRAAAGYLIAGPVGLLLGQAGKENSKLVCKECNHRWDFKETDLNEPEQAKIQKKELSIDNIKKKCPSCAEKIKLEAIKCRYCGEKFNPADVSKAIKKFKSNNEVF